MVVDNRKGRVQERGWKGKREVEHWRNKEYGTLKSLEFLLGVMDHGQFSRKGCDQFYSLGR
jgi:hypothetical protein